MNSNKILLFLAVFAGFAAAGIETLTNYKLAEQSLQNKNRFVFSDFSSVGTQLKNASIDIDIYARPVNYITNDQKYPESQKTKLRFYLMIADTSIAKIIYKDLYENQLEIEQLGIDTILSRYTSLMTYYKTIDFPEKWDKDLFNQNRIQEKIQIHHEGVYYTYFIYEQIPDTQNDPETSQTTTGRIDPTGHHLLGLADRHLKASGDDALKTKADAEQASLVINGEAQTEHVEITGSLKFRNSHGYLNAEQYPFMKYYPVMTLIYMGFLTIWILLMKKYQDQLINLHYYVLVTICICFLECVFNWSLYGFINRKGEYSSAITLLCMALEIFRSTFARVVTLVVALGYGILIKSIEKYQAKILSVSFLYMASLAAYNGIIYINHNSPVSGPVALIVSFPLSILNTFFGFWIYSAFRRTLHYLTQKEQTYKFNIISKLFICVCICLFASLLLFVMEIIVLITYQRDTDWMIMWAWESSWFWIFTLFVMSIIIILKPDEKSAMLVHMQEILDETLTEMPTEDRGDIGNTIEDQVEMHQFDIESLDSSPSVGGKSNALSLTEQSSSEQSQSTVRSVTSEQIPDDMTMEEFQSMKRKQRMEKLKEKQEQNQRAGEEN